MITLLMFILMLIVVARLAGYGMRELILTGERQPSRRRLRRARVAAEAAAQADRVAVRAPETPLESLQRRFAAGELTMEEYEREVGLLFGVRDGGN